MNTKRLIKSLLGFVALTFIFFGWASISDLRDWTDSVWYPSDVSAMELSRRYNNDIMHIAYGLGVASMVYVVACIFISLRATLGQVRLIRICITLLAALLSVTVILAVVPKELAQVNQHALSGEAEVGK